MYWHRQFHVYVLIGMCLAEPSCQRSNEAHDGAVLKEETRDDFFSTAFLDLRDGGRLYVGSVETVKVTKRESEGEGAVAELGKFTVRVQRAVRGPMVKELHLNYDFLDYDPNGPPIIFNSGDAFLRGPWRKRPQVGEQVLLQLILNPYCNRAEQNWERDTQVEHVWVGVGPDHPLVKDFEVAVRYLETRDEAEHLSCFRQLCHSAWPTIRGFARDAVTYGPYGIIAKSKAGDEDWPSKSRLRVEYVKTAGPLLTDWERAYLTGSLRFALCRGSEDAKDRPFADWLSRHANDAAAEWLAVFEDWYLTELESDAMRPNPERSERALSELRTLVQQYGIDGTATFFPNHGLAGLEKSLKKCVQSPNPDLATNAEQLLHTLHSGKHKKENKRMKSNGENTENKR